MCAVAPAHIGVSEATLLVPWGLGGWNLGAIWEFPKIRGTLFGVLIIRILLFRVLY